MGFRFAPVVIAVALFAADVSAQTCSTLPNLFIVQDRSGSMTESPNPACSNCSSKWAIARAAVSNMTTQYAAQFKFGLGMFPSTSNTGSCTVGGTYAAIGTAPATINSIYSQTSPFGGTPTAVSLDATRNYLASLNLTVPTYVLLITDGMPNCNTSLNPNTCTSSGGGTCGASTCCLDDVRTRTAADNLRLAGFKVYVVGFGASTTTTNNKAMLDSIANAGGTTSAYSATDQASLSNALSAIAGQINTCCTNACAAGATQCSATGEKKTCVMQTNGCTDWSTQRCNDFNTCSGGSCVPCSNACTLGALKCENRHSYKCVESASRCTVWEQLNPCQQGQDCVGPSCGSCQSCTEGASRCNGNTAEICTADGNGCTQWQTKQTCGSFCSGGACGTCGTSCTVGAKRCNGNTVETCAVDPNGCTAFAVTNTCASDKVCGDGECLSTCTAGEFAGCLEPGYICQLSGASGVCVRDPNAPVDTTTVEPDAGNAPSPATTTTGNNNRSDGSFDAVSSGCSMSGAPPLMLLALAAAALLRRRARVAA